MKHLSHKESDFCYRFFNHDMENGILAIGYLTRSQTNDFFKEFSNKYYCCSLLIKGRGVLVDSEGKEYALAPNVVFQRFPGHSYSLIPKVSDEWYEFCISIGKNVYEALSSLNLLYTAYPVFPIRMMPYLEQWMPVLLNQLKSTDAQELAEVLFNTQKFLINLHKEGVRSYDSDVSQVIAASRQLLSKQQYKETLNLKEIAASFNMSYEKYRKLFKEEVGVSPLQFHLQCKFQVAQRLLTEGLSIKAVADEMGYQDPFIFSRQFKKYMGVPPSHFKRHP
jgi:AraC family transcriptional regulator, arabinose operon regulatory protein